MQWSWLRDRFIGGTIHKAYGRAKFQGISHNSYGLKNGTFTYLHFRYFRILKLPLIYAILCVISIPPLWEQNFRTVPRCAARVPKLHLNSLGWFPLTRGVNIQNNYGTSPSWSSDQRTQCAIFYVAFFCHYRRLMFALSRYSHNILNHFSNPLLEVGIFHYPLVN